MKQFFSAPGNNRLPCSTGHVIRIFWDALQKRRSTGGGEKLGIESVWMFLVGYNLAKLTDSFDTSCDVNFWLNHIIYMPINVTQNSSHYFPCVFFKFKKGCTSCVVDSGPHDRKFMYVVLRTRWWTFGFRKIRDISWLGNYVIAAQKRPFYMKLGS